MRPHVLMSFTLFAVASAFSASIVLADTTYSPPTLSGKPIDRCVNDGKQNNCDSTANRIAATTFCKVKGHQEAVSWSIDTKNVIPKAAKRAAKKLDNSLQFVDIIGLHTFTKIVCKSEQETRRYSAPVMNGMRIDKCVQGAGWGFLDPQRCDNTRQRQIAAKYCLEKGFRDRFSYLLEKHLGNHAILTFRKGDSYRRGVWTQVAGTVVFKEIVCVR